VVYQIKLQTPLNNLVALSEALLYLQRKMRLLGILSKEISGLPVQDFEQEVGFAIQRQIEESQNLSVDQVVAKAPTLSSIWSEIQRDIAIKGSNGRATAKLSGANKAISTEICQGDFDRISQLTALNTETAACLAQWHGKDLYLNGITELSIAAAKALVEWPGEWLSLNGLREISPEIAQQLSLWPGKRLSLNGLSNLSNQATAHLSKFSGDQLELVGLAKIGGWKNYTTRLYLSEALQRKLQLN
jgi:hypothetical protein